MSGVTMRSVMSVSTVKVGTTMKSMKPGDAIRDAHKTRRSVTCYRGALPVSQVSVTEDM